MVLQILSSAVILLLIALLAFIGHLSVRRAWRVQQRPYRGFWVDTFPALWQGNGEHFFPILYREPNADPYLRRLQRKRNGAVLLFWGLWLVIVLRYFLR